MLDYYWQPFLECHNISAGDNDARFSVTPGAGDVSAEGGYSEWLHAMRLVARLPAGVPQHFRKKVTLGLP